MKIILFTEAVNRPGGHFGVGSGPIYLGAVMCSGSETNISMCNNGTTASCSHAVDAGVSCSVSKYDQFTFE